MESLQVPGCAAEKTFRARRFLGLFAWKTIAKTRAWLKQLCLI